ncbi:mandelate racemase family protein [Haloarcula japonica]|uniref:Mandelate racemase/muconate lactonizing enzyme family protein n=1 Tax=Haloarcula japonica (strain ATCC 49778 / DSM 6131 / JCM 7785 / NBRC 101032 / NCIMB 13157 / TR-1) TaxID=1227453 RepID=M0L671_HALJT|nr:mandelate racemase family protein [Haloarcula japonica]EMA29011.1 mandelate racemase/muconate lactonizing enzyme family protein [Haloarcula japonica DSM 6131]
MSPTITKIESREFEYPLEDVGTDKHGFNLVYAPGETTTRKLFGVQIHTDEGITGEYVGGNSPAAAQYNIVSQYLIGKDPLKREKHWSECKRALRKYDRMGIGPIDIALWDFAGKYYDAPIHELLGTYRERIPAYASTYHGDDAGGLDSPEAFADFAEECRDEGFGGFKIHGWGGGDDARSLDREVEAVHAVGEAVGDEMDLMHDPACELETFADALELGRALDEQGFFWYEDPFRDGGISQHAHKKLAQKLDTPILQTEHIRGLEIKSDFAASEATDFLRADPEYDAGITGAIKVARMAEAFGLDVEFHAPGPAQRHCIAACRNSNYYEMALVHPDCQNTQPPVYEGGYSDLMDAVDDDGTVGVPDGPGLGVEYDWDYIEDNTTGSVHVYE